MNAPLKPACRVCVVLWLGLVAWLCVLGAIHLIELLRGVQP